MERNAWAVMVCGGLVGSMVLGCEDQLTPSDVAGTYALHTVDGQPPPIIILATTECDVTVVSGTMTLTTGRNHDIVIDTPADCTRGGGGITMAGRTYPGTYELRGTNTIRFRSPVPNGPALVYTGTVAGDRITVTVPDLGSGLTPDLTVSFVR
jgi:hypothetical protein